MSKSSRRWLQEHFSDPFVKQAHQVGYRSRAVYKLMEIHQKDHLFKPGMTVIDLGAAPGGWLQFVLPLIQPHGRLIAVDILPIAPMDGVEMIQGDFSEEAVLQAILGRLGDKKADWVISDMAPNMSGQASVDIPKAMYLAELAFDLALKVLDKQGGLLIKVFQGEGFDALFSQIKHTFKQVSLRKPKASRNRSREVYLLARVKQ